MIRFSKALLRDRLRESGYPEIDTAEFRDTIADIFADMFPGGYSPDEMIVNNEGPETDCARFRDAVRARFGMARNREQCGVLVLLTLLSLRKQGRMSDRDKKKRRKAKAPK